MRRIIVINSKGGCGKTTISTNLASHYAGLGYSTALFDYDPQGSSSFWLDRRPPDLPPVYGVKASSSRGGSITRAWQLRIPPSTQRIIMDMPAALTRPDFNDYLRGVDMIVIPVQPSPIDTHAAADFIRDLLLVNKVRQHQDRIAVVVNRVRGKTASLQKLERFVRGLHIPVIAQLHDTQGYITAAEQGRGIHELENDRAQREVSTWNDIMHWLERLPEPA